MRRVRENIVAAEEH